MSGHGGNPTFFNKKINIERPDHSLNPHPPTSDNIPLKVDVTCVSPLKLILKRILKILKFPKIWKWKKSSQEKFFCSSSFHS